MRADPLDLAGRLGLRVCALLRIGRPLPLGAIFDASIRCEADVTHEDRRPVCAAATGWRCVREKTNGPDPVGHRNGP